MYKCPVDNCDGYVMLEATQPSKPIDKKMNVILCPKSHNNVIIIGGKGYYDIIGWWFYGKNTKKDKVTNYYSCRVKRLYFPKMYRYIQRLKRTVIWYLVYKHIADSNWAEYGIFTFLRKKKPGYYGSKRPGFKDAFERAKYDRNGFDLFTNDRY